MELSGRRTKQIAAFRADTKPGEILKAGNFTTPAAVAATAYDLKGRQLANFELSDKK